MIFAAVICKLMLARYHCVHDGIERFEEAMLRAASPISNKIGGPTAPSVLPAQAENWTSARHPHLQITTANITIPLRSRVRR